MKTIKEIDEWLDRHPVFIAISILLSFGALGKILHGFEVLRRLSSDFIISGLRIDWNARQIDIKAWFFFVLFGILYSLACLSVFLLRSRRLLGRYKMTLDEQSRLVDKTLRGMMAAASRIKAQLFPHDRVPAVAVISSKQKCFISSSFDAEMTWEYKFKALGQPLHFWEFETWVEEEATGMHLLDGLDFKVEDDNGRGLSYLPTLDNLRRKKVIIYFLPQIDPEEAEARTVIVSYKWPRMFGRLDLNGQEYWTWILHSNELIKQARFEVYLESGTNRIFECQSATAPADGETLKEAEIDKGPNKWKGWIYNIPDAPPGEYTLSLKLKRP